MNKRKVILEFPDLKTLVDYTVFLDITDYQTDCELIRSKFILICELSEADITIALKEFRAYIIE